MSHLIEDIDKMEQARGKETMGFGVDGNTNQFNIVDVDSQGRQSSKQYVWDTDSLSWVAAGAAGGIIGGGGSSAVSYITLMDDTGTYLYVGEAMPNTSPASASWRIKRVSDTSVLYADGNANFDNIWNNRSSYSYS